jgi:ABC-type Zn uptake system ZnuABC Zn-binding protein ZnuA
LKSSSESEPGTIHEWVKNTKKRLVRNDKECTAFLFNAAQTSKKLEEYEALVEKLKTEIEQLKQRSS